MYGQRHFSAHLHDLGADELRCETLKNNNQVHTFRNDTIAVDP